MKATKVTVSVKVVEMESGREAILTNSLPLDPPCEISEAAASELLKQAQARLVERLKQSGPAQKD